jgi:hypothetical protein
MKDATNPAHVFSTAETELLLRIKREKIDIDALLRRELTARGIDENGAWIGFAAAKQHWSSK